MKYETLHQQSTVQKCLIWELLLSSFPCPIPAVFSSIFPIQRPELQDVTFLIWLLDQDDNIFVSFGDFLISWVKHQITYRCRTKAHVSLPPDSDLSCLVFTLSLFLLKCATRQVSWKHTQRSFNKL